MLSLAKVPQDGRYQFHALFPDWNGPVGNLGPAPSGAFSLTAKRRSETSAALAGVRDSTLVGRFNQSEWIHGMH
jgi:hypothetical protein